MLNEKTQMQDWRKVMQESVVASWRREGLEQECRCGERDGAQGERQREKGRGDRDRHVCRQGRRLGNRTRSR